MKTKIKYYMPNKDTHKWCKCHKFTSHNTIYYYKSLQLWHINLNLEDLAHLETWVKYTSLMTTLRHIYDMINLIDLHTKLPLCWDIYYKTIRLPPKPPILIDTNGPFPIHWVGVVFTYQLEYNLNLVESLQDAPLWVSFWSSQSPPLRPYSLVVALSNQYNRISIMDV